MKSSSILLILKTRYAPQMERRNEAPEDDNGASPRTLQCIRSRNVPLPTTSNDWLIQSASLFRVEADAPGQRP
ncbi:hypothetical protein J2S34_002229 [Nitrobacter winogradskyi]|uniref:Uncharacterized protein n=1 Tax=Nitrobacter winogradskyi TaxID=913 RepID=A0ACC6AKH3_NITWI|nr:hypothetical protein [Nitrobacter winogradskyi]